jgi:hypothetical protein
VRNMFSSTKHVGNTELNNTEPNMLVTAVFFHTQGLPYSYVRNTGVASHMTRFSSAHPSRTHFGSANKFLGVKKKHVYVSACVKSERISEPYITSVSSIS